MPKVSNVRIRIDNEIQSFDIHYNKKDCFHVKNFPSSVLQFTDKHNGLVTANFQTEHELKNSLHECVNRYHEAMTCTRKVIRYKLYASTEIRMNKNDDHSWYGVRPGINKNIAGIDGHHTPDYAIGFDYSILLETKSNGLKYNEIKSDGSIGCSINVYPDDIIIDWTIDRELAFQILSDGMYKLMRKISGALGDKEDALKFLDSKVKLIQ